MRGYIFTPHILGSKFMVSNEDGPISGINDEDIGVAAQTLTGIPTIKASDPDRFVIEIRNLTEERAQAGWPGESDANVAAFVMVPYPRQVQEHYEIERVLDLRANPRPVLGELLFLSIDGTHGCTMPMPTDDAGILDWLEDEGFKDSPIVLVYRGTLKMVSRTSGATGDARYDQIRETMPEVTLNELLDALDCFHIDNLLTPSGGSKGVWESGLAKNYVPGEHPEKSIQYGLMIALRSWFRRVVSVELEDSIPAGRIDVRLLHGGQGDKPLSYWAVIELKIMRSKRNAPKGKKASSVSIPDNVSAVVEGLKQINSYRRDRHAEEGLLEVFDMRKDKSIDIKGEAAVIDQCKIIDQDIVFNVRPLFGTTREARDAGFL